MINFLQKYLENNNLFKIANKYQYKYNETKYFNLYKKFKVNYYIIRKKFNNQSLITLYVGAGITQISFLNNFLILNRNINKIKTIYNEIIFIIFNFDLIYIPFIKVIEEEKVLNNTIDIKYAINDILRKKSSKNIIKIILEINKESKYDMIDLMGVSFSGGLFTFIGQKKILLIRNLILIEPAIFEGFTKKLYVSQIFLCWCKETKENNLECIKFSKQLDNIIMVISDFSSKNISDKYITHRLQDSIFNILYNMYYIT